MVALLLALGASVAPAMQPLAGCTLLLGAPQNALMLPTNAVGFASHVVPVPAQSALVGVDMRFQAASMGAVLPRVADIRRKRV